MLASLMPWLLQMRRSWSQWGHRPLWRFAPLLLCAGVFATGSRGALLVTLAAIVALAGAPEPPLALAHLECRHNRRAWLFITGPLSMLQGLEGSVTSAESPSITADSTRCPSPSTAGK